MARYSMWNKSDCVESSLGDCLEKVRENAAAYIEKWPGM
jgi:hypothetical protein